MASTAESQVANLAGVVHSLPRESFAAEKSIFTEPADDGLSNTQYGAPFLSLDGRAMTPSLLGARLAQLLRSEQVVYSRLVRNLTAPILVIVTSTIKTGRPGYGVSRFPAEWGSEHLVALRIVPAAMPARSGGVPGCPFSRGCAAKRIGPNFGIRTVGSFDVAA